MELLHKVALSLLLLIASPVSAKQASGVVTGTVRYGDTGGPANGKRLWLTRVEAADITRPDPKTGEYVIKDKNVDAEKSLSTVVRADGTFVLQSVPTGTYFVHIFCPGYISPDDTVFPTSNTAHVSMGPVSSPDTLKVRVVADQPSMPIHIELQRGGAIEGVVRSAQAADVTVGSSLSGFAVNAERKLGANSYARVGGAVHTDDKGHYRLDGLAPGSYIIFIGRGGPMIRTANGTSRGSSGLPIYAPGTVRPSQAAVVDIRHSETQHLDVVLPNKTTLHRIEGNVEVDGVETLQNAIVRLYPTAEGGLTAASPLSAQKSFSFLDVPDGDYTVEVEFPSIPKLVSVDAGKGIIHMRMVPPDCASATQDIHVAGHDVTDILLTPAHH